MGIFKKELAYKRLKDLGEEKMAIIDRMLLAGTKTKEVADVIQQEWGANLDLSRDSMARTLLRYRGSVLKNKVIAGIVNAQKSDPDKQDRGISVATMFKRLNAMDEMEKLVAIQKGRFEKMLMREQSGPLLMKSVTGEAQLMQNMLVDLGRLQLETGILARAPKKVTGTVTDSKTGEQREFVWTEEQEKLFKELEGVLGEAK